MCHEANVRFVYAHAESNGGGDHQPWFLEKTFLMPGACFCRHASVIGQGRDPFPPQPNCCLFGTCPGEAVDDAGLAALRLDEIQELAAAGALGLDAIANVPSVKATEKFRPFRLSEVSADVLRRSGVRCCCQRQARNPRKQLGQPAQSSIFGPEVRAPLTDALRFID